VLLQLDTWFGTKKKEKGRGGGGQLPRPHSESDFNEVAEQEFFVEQLDADEMFLNEKFEEMLVCMRNYIVVLSAAVGRKQSLLSTKKIKLAYTLNIHIST
jgi:hypothetical protein